MEKLKLDKIKNAFTLAEVLITLGIIGIVAALTIPALMKNTQDVEFRNKLKKEYSVLNQAFRQIANDNGGEFSTATSSCATTSCVVNLFSDKMSAVKTCTALGDCIASSTAKFLNGNPASLSGIITAATDGLILKDGASFVVYMDNYNCERDMTALGYNQPVCGWITMDVNGLQKPNVVGRDIYWLRIQKNSITPAKPDELGGDDCKADNAGFSCAYKYVIGNS